MGRISYYLISLFFLCSIANAQLHKVAHVDSLYAKFAQIDSCIGCGHGGGGSDSGRVIFFEHGLKVTQDADSNYHVTLDTTFIKDSTTIGSGGSGFDPSADQEITGQWRFSNGNLNIGLTSTNHPTISIATNGGEVASLTIFDWQSNYYTALLPAITNVAGSFQNLLLPGLLSTTTATLATIDGHQNFTNVATLNADSVYANWISGGFDSTGFLAGSHTWSNLQNLSDANISGSFYMRGGSTITGGLNFINGGFPTDYYFLQGIGANLCIRRFDGVNITTVVQFDGTTGRTNILSGLKLTSLPTDSTGLAAGTIWRLGSDIHIKQ